MHKLMLLLLLSVACSIGCTHTDAYLGTTATVDRYITFYFKAGYDQYVFDPGMMRFIVMDPEWSAPEGLTVESPQVTVAETSISWKVDRTRYTVKGFKVHATCRVKIDSNAQTGVKEVKLRLPVVQEITKQTSSSVSFENWSGGDFAVGTTVESFDVQTSQLMNQIKWFLLLAALTAPPVIPVVLIVKKCVALTKGELPESVTAAPNKELVTRPGPFDPAAWNNGIQTSIEKFLRALREQPGSLSEAMRKQLEHLQQDGPALATLSREASIESMKKGEVCSTLTVLNNNPVLIVIFPDLVTHANGIRKYEEFADGWLSHSARVYQHMAAQKTAQPLVCVLIFLSPNGTANQISFAYEANDGRLASAELIDSRPEADRRPLVALNKGLFPFVASK